MVVNQFANGEGLYENNPVRTFVSFKLYFYRLEVILVEEWKKWSCNGLEYLVSNTGRIIGTYRKREILQRLNEDGYCVVSVGNLKNRVVKRVHRIVAEVFVNGMEEFMEVNHKDFNRTNNNYNNLEWITHRENIAYSTLAGNMSSDKRRGSKNGRAILNEEKVREIKEMIKCEKSNRKIAKKYNVHDSTIWNIRVGNTWKNT